jgi:hypothetical protein
LALQAGLFSAVLTAFVVESYQSLQEDYAQTSVELLRRISHQLANSSFPAAPDTSQFHAQQSDVQVNVCWFVSLLLSLTVALFGIFLKQWMRTYMKWMDVTPNNEAVSVRHFRFRGLESWHFATTLALLPTLLQLSVILFLSGLLVFLWNLDRTVAHIMAVLTSITFFLVLTVTILPVFSQSCPYRSSLSEFVVIPLQHVVNYVKSVVSVAWDFIQDRRICGPARSSPPPTWSTFWAALPKLHWTMLPTSWLDVDKDALARRANGSNISMDVSVMVHLCRTTQSTHLWEAIITAITEDGPVVDENDDNYCNEVWWPIIGIIMPLNKEWITFGPPTLFLTVESRFKSFSLSMQDCWLDFLSRLEDLVCRSHSEHMVKAYLLCCITCVGSHRGSQRMLALVAVLQRHHLKLDGHWLDSIADSLSVHASDIWNSADWYIESCKRLCNIFFSLVLTTHQAPSSSRECNAFAMNYNTCTT